MHLNVHSVVCQLHHNFLKSGELKGKFWTEGPQFLLVQNVGGRIKDDDRYLPEQLGRWWCPLVKWEEMGPGTDPGTVGN